MSAPDFRLWDDATIAEAVASANLPTLLVAIVHPTGDAALLRGEIRPRRASPQRPDAGLEAHAGPIRERALRALQAFRDGDRSIPSLPPVHMLEEMMSFSLGQKLEPEYVPMLLEEMMLAGDGRAAPDLGDLATARDFRAIIIGAGVSGILAAIKLGQAGIRYSLYGPNTNLAHGGSIIFHSECQVRYVLGCFELLLRRRLASIDCTPAAHDAYNARVDAEHARMIWSQPNVTNWFKNAAGRVTTHSPFRLVDYWSMTRSPDPADYLLTPLPA